MGTAEKNNAQVYWHNGLTPIHDKLLKESTEFQNMHGNYMYV